MKKALAVSLGLVAVLVAGALLGSRLRSAPVAASSGVAAVASNVSWPMTPQERIAWEGIEGITGRRREIEAAIAAVGTDQRLVALVAQAVEAAYALGRADGRARELMREAERAHGVAVVPSGAQWVRAR